METAADIQTKRVIFNSVSLKWPYQLLLLSFYCISSYICHSGTVVPCTVAELWNCSPPQELQPPCTAKDKDDPWFKQLMLHHFSRSIPISFLFLVSNEPLNLPAVAPPCRSWKGLSHTKATVSEGLVQFCSGRNNLLSYALQGSSCTWDTSVW